MLNAFVIICLVRISSKGEYGLLALVDLALHNNGEPFEVWICSRHNHRATSILRASQRPSCHIESIARKTKARLLAFSPMRLAV